MDIDKNISEYYYNFSIDLQVLALTLELYIEITSRFLIE